MPKPRSKWIGVRVLVLTGVAFSFLTGINNSGGDSTADEVELVKARLVNERAMASEARATPASNRGDIKFIHKQRNSFRGPAPNRTALVSQRAVSRAVEQLKERIALPFDIKVVFAECGGPDSHYDQYAHEIIICYELIDVYYDLFSRTLTARRARDEAVKGAVVSMFLHEVAHALIDGWDLPSTGREEDAADQFATLWMINRMPDGEQLALDGARSFKLLADLEKGQAKDYSDAHSLDEQRFFNTICLVYGHRPTQYESLIRNGILPVDRAFECEEDYARLNKSWQKLLAPYLVDQKAQLAE